MCSLRQRITNHLSEIQAWLIAFVAWLDSRSDDTRWRNAMTVPQAGWPQIRWTLSWN